MSDLCRLVMSWSWHGCSGNGGTSQVQKRCLKIRIRGGRRNWQNTCPVLRLPWRPCAEICQPSAKGTFRAQIGKPVTTGTISANAGQARSCVRQCDPLGRARSNTGQLWPNLARSGNIEPEVRSTNLGETWGRVCRSWADKAQHRCNHQHISCLLAFSWQISAQVNLGRRCSGHVLC